MAEGVQVSLDPPSVYAMMRKRMVGHLSEVEMPGIDGHFYSRQHKPVEKLIEARCHLQKRLRVEGGTAAPVEAV